MQRKHIHIIGSLTILVAISACITMLVCNRIVLKAADGLMYSDVTTIPANRVGVLLGTSPIGRNGNPNPYYTNRIQACVALYQAGKIERVLISGDNSRTEYDEPTWIQNDLVSAGIPDSAIYLDYAGFRTLDSMVRAKKIFGLQQFTIISQQFHNERALYLAHSNNIDAIAFNANNVSTRRWQLLMTMREYLARTNAVMDICFSKQPHFLGEPITIE